MKIFRELLSLMPSILLLLAIITFFIYSQLWIVFYFILGIVLIFFGVIVFVGALFGLGFRNKLLFDDYVMYLESEMAFLRDKGYQQIEYINLGSAHPGILMRRENSPEIKIIFNAPIIAFKYTVDICIMTDKPVRTHYNVDNNIDLKIAKMSRLYESAHL